MIVYDDALLKKVQKVDLEIAKYFADFCKANKLLCYLCGGGCIGAVRHHGFIPWDDDLDFFLPREDYEKLKTVWTDTERYILTWPTEDYHDHCMFMTLRDKTTTMIKPYQKNMNIVHGISIDIFPLDGYPNSWLKRTCQVFWGFVYQLYCAQVIPEKHGRIITMLGMIGLRLVPSQKARYRIWRYAENKMSKYRIEDCDSITEICAGPRYMMNRYPKQCFSSAIEEEFEGVRMPIPVGYNQYLTIAFGDYMQLPPKEEQVPSHDALVVDPERPYTDYLERVAFNGSEIHLEGG